MGKATKDNVPRRERLSVGELGRVRTPSQGGFIHDVTVDLGQERREEDPSPSRVGEGRDDVTKAQGQNNENADQPGQEKVGLSQGTWDGRQLQTACVYGKNRRTPGARASGTTGSADRAERSTVSSRSSGHLTAAPHRT